MAPLAQAQTDWIDNCLKRLDPQTDIGYERLSARCPDLKRRVDESGWAAWLPQDWQSPGNDLSAGSLRELRASVSRELATRTGARELPLTSLQPVLERLGEVDRKRGSALARFQGWLREVLDRRDEPSSDGWLARLLSRMSVSDAVARVISWACLAVVVVLAGVIVGNEFRVAGVLARWRRKIDEGDVAGAPGRGLRALSWSDVQAAALADRPRLLLQLIAARLVEKGLLPQAGGLTVREMLQQARLADTADGALLADVALAAERAAFADEPVSPEGVETVLEQGRRLLWRIGEGSGGEGP